MISVLASGSIITNSSTAKPIGQINMGQIDFFINPSVASLFVCVIITMYAYANFRNRMLGKSITF